jgi:hypothetical protein
LIISNIDKKILFVSKAYAGSVHDYKILKSELDCKVNWFKKIKEQILVDLGFLGIKKDYLSPEKIRMPYKKPRTSKKNPKTILSENEKLYNKTVSKKRVYVEHSIGMMKFFYSLVHKFRNKSLQFSEMLSELCAGISNLKLERLPAKA